MLPSATIIGEFTYRMPSTMPEGLKFAHFGRLDQISDLAARGLTNGAWRLKIGPNDLVPV